MQQVLAEVRSVLVVDDYPENAEMLAELVASYGHRVRIAGDGAEALALLAAEPASLVFLDVGLPDMDGYEVAAAIRARLGAGCQIVALTGFDGQEERAAALRAGCDAFLVKPFKPLEIERLLAAPGGPR